MALYTGETIVITQTATLDQVSVSNLDVSDVEITIFNADGDEVVSPQSMIWNTLRARWEYVWDTSPADVALPVGAYRAKVKISGVDGSENWEYKTIRLKRNPV
jgi:hypothetical protein